MRAIFAPRRATEASPEQVATVGGAISSWGADPLDNDTGYRPIGKGRREVPEWTREKAITYSVTAYRTNPMARAIIDTYVAFCVGDSGVKWQATNPDVAKVVDEFWSDPYNQVGKRQELALRSMLLWGERLLEMMEGSTSGVVRFCPYDPATCRSVKFYKQNPNWPERLMLTSDPGEEDLSWTAVRVNDTTGLREGQAMLWRPFRSLETDERSQPFLMPILDPLDSYDVVLSNLVDRTHLARYMVWDVTVEGGQKEVDEFVAGRGGTHIPPSGSVEVHGSSVKWEPRYVNTGADEDSVTAKQMLTMVAGGAGLAKTWLADPEDSNRATSLTMAEPVRRRVGGVQRVWLEYQTELCRYPVDRAVAAKRLPATVESTDPTTGEVYEIPAAQCVTVHGPEIAAADAQLGAQVLLNLSTGLQAMVEAGIMSPEAAKVAARKAWEGYVGVPYTAQLDSAEANPDDLAELVDKAPAKEGVLLALARGA